MSVHIANQIIKKQIGTVIIACPSSLVFNWCNELNNWAPFFCVSALIDTGKHKNEIWENANTILINFLENNNSFSEEEWKEMNKFANETFVDESDELKQKSAGAGLTDND